MANLCFEMSWGGEAGEEMMQVVSSVDGVRLPQPTEFLEWNCFD
jgi:hypothetical protein